MSRLTAIYARVSSSHQREEKTIESQLSALREYAKAQDLVVPEAWVFEDAGVSGALLVRPALERLRDLVAEGQVEVVLVHSPDRLSRKYAYQFLLLEEFKRRGVQTLFVKGGQANTPEEELTLEFQAIIAEYERAQIAERSRRGILHRAKAGSVNVLTAAPYGYRYVPKRPGCDACYVVQEEEAQVVREIFSLYTQEQMGLAAIARLLQQRGIPTRTGQAAWKRSALWAMLKNPTYMGLAAYGKTKRVPAKRASRRSRQKGTWPSGNSSFSRQPVAEWLRIPVPALVSQEVYALAQERLAKNKQQSLRNTKEPSLLQGLLVCGQCGYSLYRSSTQKKCRYHYYRCRGSDFYRQSLPKRCPCHSMRVEQLDSLVWEQVLTLLENPSLIGAELERRRQESLGGNPAEQHRELLQQELRRLNQQMDKLLDAYQEGLVALPELRERIPLLRQKREAKEQELAKAQWQCLTQGELQKMEESIEDFLERLRTSAHAIDLTERRKVIRLLVKEIVVGKDAITVKHCIPLTGGVRDAAGTSAGGYQLCTKRLSAFAFQQAASNPAAAIAWLTFLASVW